MEKWVIESADCRRELIALRSIPGVGPILSTTIALETGDIARFAGIGDYASYCRMVKSERLSNDKKKGAGNRKCGNKYLAWAYIEATYSAAALKPASPDPFGRSFTDAPKFRLNLTTSNCALLSFTRVFRGGYVYVPNCMSQSGTKVRWTLGRLPNNGPRLD